MVSRRGGWGEGLGGCMFLKKGGTSRRGDEKRKGGWLIHPSVLLIKNNTNALIVTETKLNSSFSCGQFSIDGFTKPLHRDSNKNGHLS